MMRLADFQVLSFDCYGTLIDWETGLIAGLQPVLTRAGVGLGRDDVLAEFATAESRQQTATPSMRYADLLIEVHGQLAQTWGVAADPAESARFGASVGDWPPFPDTVDALRRLGQRCKLVILSNVDRESFQATQRRLGVDFHAIYTAQDVGAVQAGSTELSVSDRAAWGARDWAGADTACGTEPVSRPCAGECGRADVGVDRSAAWVRGMGCDRGAAPRLYTTTSGLRAWGNWRTRSRAASDNSNGRRRMIDLHCGAGHTVLRGSDPPRTAGASSLIAGCRVGLAIRRFNPVGRTTDPADHGRLPDPW